MSKRLIFLTSFVLVLSLVSNTIGQPTGEILIEYWNNIGGTTMDDLYNNALFPDSPDEGEYLTSFDRPYDRPAPNNDNYGARARGFLYPPETGDYTFWVAADDDCDLFLSTDDDPANKVLIAEINGWCDPYDWDNATGSDNPGQVSAPVTLEGGVKYYIEGAYKEGGGGDGIGVAWQGPGIPDRVVIAGDYLSPAAISAVLLKAKNPNPADGAVDADTASLEWVGGQTSVSYKVYLSSDATIEESDLAAETDLTIHLAALDIGAAYYWRVDVVEADGTVIEGNLWSFTTLPLEAHFPNPADGAKSQPLDSQLSWTAGKGVIMHDVYFGTDEALVAAGDPSTFKGKVMVTSYDPGALEMETTYYWKIDEFSVTGTNAGPVWSFTSFGAVEITDPDLLLYYDFESGEGSVAIDQSGHSNHGLFMGTPEWATGYLGGGLAIESADADYIQTAGSLGITSNTITVAGWVKHDELPAGWSGILTHRGTSPGCLGLQHDGTELRYMWGADVYWSFSSGLSLPVGEWYFAALTISPDQGKLYLNGIEQTATNVAPHEPTNFDSQIRVARDHNDDRVMTCLIDEVRLYNKTLTDVEILELMGTISDVTAPGDIVQGVPNDGDWPGGETPDLAIDDDIGTKFLHFKGSDEPTGIQIEPASGASIVTGLTFTTANDAIERDPISYELSGSNDSIDGPYTLIASGDIVDFAQETAISRFTMNATAIMFKNDVAYAYYQVMFPAVRDAASANSMQIAEVELLGVPAPIARWEFEGDFEGGIPYGDISFEKDPDMGKVLSLPGGDDQYVDLGSVGISGNMPRTIAVWAKADNTSIPDWTLIFGFTGDENGDGGNGSHFNIGSLGGPGGVGAHVWGWEDTIFSDDEALEWHHYAMTFDGTTISYYGDGQLVGTSVQDLSISADRVHVGSRITQASSFPGKVDDARIYGLVLTQTQVRGVMNEPRPPANIAWVSYHAGDDEPHADAAAVGFTQAPDIAYTDLLKAQGYNVVRVLTSQTPDVEFLNTMDLVIISRTASSGHYSNEGATAWNSITAPMINLNGYTLRSSRLGFTDGTDMPDTTGDVTLTVTDPTHPIFAGIDLVDGTMVNPFAEGAVPLPTDGVTLSRGISINNNTANPEGTVLAVISDASADTGPAGGMVIAEWPAGATLTHDGGAGTDILAGDRLVFLTGSREPDGVTGGQAAALYDLYGDGTQMLLNAVDYMLNPPAPAAANLLANGGFEDGVTDPWSTYGDATMEVVTELVDAAVPEAPVEGSSCLHVTVASAGANFWDAGLQNAGHVFEAGKAYTLSAYLKSKSGTLDINFKPELAADPWSGFGDQVVTMTEEWAQYSVTTPVMEADVDPASITFHIAFAAAEFWVDDVQWTEVE